MSVNTQGKHLLDLCISSRLRIVNGRHAGEKRGGLHMLHYQHHRIELYLQYENTAREYN